MKNFVQPGDQIKVTAPYDVVSGAGCLVGSLFGVAVHSALSGAPVEIRTSGVIRLAKAGSQGWSQGVRIYWDDSAKVATSAAAAGANKLIGVAAETVGSGAGDTLGNVLLTGAFTL